MTIVYRFKLDTDEYIEVESQRPINAKVFYESPESDRKELEWVPTEDALTAEAAIARLDDKYDLIYVQYDDKLSDEQVDALVSGDLETFWELLSTFEMDSRDQASQYVIDQEFETEEWESLSVEDQDEVRRTIEERDESNWVDELISHTPDPLLRAWAIDEDNGWNCEEVTAEQVLDAIGFEHTEHNLNVINQALPEVSPEFSVVLGQWVMTLDLQTLYKSNDDDKLRITNPYVHLGNPFSGSGWLTEKPLEGSIVLERNEIHTDKQGFGYSMNDIFGGLSSSQYEAQVEIIKAEVDDDGE